eukprot:5522634-Prymnesium_polylepis.1
MLGVNNIGHHAPEEAQMYAPTIVEFGGAAVSVHGHIRTAEGGDEQQRARNGIELINDLVMLRLRDTARIGVHTSARLVDGSGRGKIGMG